MTVFHLQSPLIWLFFLKIPQTQYCDLCCVQHSMYLPRLMWRLNVLCQFWHMYLRVTDGTMTCMYLRMTGSRITGTSECLVAGYVPQWLVAGWHVPQSDWWQDDMYLRVTGGRMAYTSEWLVAGWHIPQSDWWQDGVYLRVTGGRMAYTSEWLVAGWRISQSDWWQDGIYLRVTGGRMVYISEWLMAGWRTCISEWEMAGWHVPQGDRWQHEMYLKMAEGRMGWKGKGTDSSLFLANWTSCYCDDNVLSLNW